MSVPLPLRILLWPASILFGFIVKIRIWLYAKGFLKQQRLNAAVISVGNLTVGGTGKTPLVIWLADQLLAQGQRVAILSRGYHGSGGTSDEIELMRSRLQNRVAFGVGKNRFEQGHFLESRQAIDVFVLDDGFQHLQLARDLDIVIIDASRPMDGQPLLPAGPMREPTTSLTRADIVVFTRTENATGAQEAMQRFSKLPIFAAATNLLGFRPINDQTLLQTTADIGEGPFFAFCGIGNPGAFVSDLKRWGVPLAGQIFFADHHRYTLDDVQTIEATAAQTGAKALLTTEKDFWNLVDVNFSTLPLYISVIDLRITGENALLSSINHLLHTRGART
jgi:tetraacyldisaccharide 4'-kinase